MEQNVRFKVNGEDYNVLVEPQQTLLEVLREKINLTGSKKGCDDGKCGACTVLLNGRAVRACLTLAVNAKDKEVTTIEGLSRNGELHALQKSFLEHGAIQCGFCSPGMIMAAKAFLDRNTKPNEAEIKEALAGNICRCTGYVKIVEAIKAASEEPGKD